MIITAIILITFCIMELIAWALHRYVMHGFLWKLHHDHHQPTSHSLQKNDSFFLLFAVPSTILIMNGISTQNTIQLGIGIGITVYGIAYFLVHEVFIHQRLSWFRNSNFFFFKAIKKAHQAHHKISGKHHAYNFGMLIVPFKYYLEALKK